MTSQDAEVEVTRVVVIDDHRMFVDSLVRLLDDESDLVVVGVANNVGQGLDAVETHAPDVVLLDYCLPDGDAPTCIARLRDAAPEARVLVITGLGDDATLAAARSAGCAGVITKDRAARDLVEAVRAVACGAPIGEADASGAGAARERSAATGRTLSPRELEVLAHLAVGETTQDVADSLAISSVTVRNHIQRILAKLGAHSRLEAVALGIERGFIAAVPRRPRRS